MPSDRSPPGSVKFDRVRPVTPAEAFVSSMPAAYRALHGPGEQRSHAEIVSRRGGAVVHVEICPKSGDSPGDVSWLCVVTDDRPGLLSCLSAAISAHSLDILSARIFCRQRVGLPDEAVDFFAVRRLKGLDPAEVTRSDAIAIGHSIEALLNGDTDIGWLERRATPTSRPSAEPSTVVRFDDRQSPDTLIVETLDRPGLLLTITLALFQMGLSIVRSNVTTAGTRARDEFEVASQTGSGAGLTLERRREVVAHVLAALEKTRGAS